jgi:hypothetical protein
VSGGLTSVKSASARKPSASGARRSQATEASLAKAIILANASRPGRLSCAVAPQPPIARKIKKALPTPRHVAEAHLRIIRMRPIDKCAALKSCRCLLRRGHFPLQEYHSRSFLSCKPVHVGSIVIQVSRRPADTRHSSEIAVWHLGSRIDLRPLTHDYCGISSFQAARHDYATRACGRSLGLFPRLRYEGSVRVFACAFGGTHSVRRPAGA